MSKLYYRLDQAIVTISNVLSTLSAICVVLLAIIVTGEVVLRYFFNSPTMWVDEIARYILLAIVFFGLAHTLHHNVHIRIDFIIDRFPPKIRKYVEISTYIIGIFFSWLLILACFYRIENFWIRNTHSYSVLQTPLYIPAIPMMVGSITFSIMLKCRLVSLIMDLFTSIRQR